LSVTMASQKSLDFLSKTR
jgi:transposase-like protein